MKDLAISRRMPQEIEVSSAFPLRWARLAKFPLRKLLLGLGLLTSLAASSAAAQQGSVAITTLAGDVIEGNLKAIAFEEFTVASAQETTKIRFDQLSTVEFGPKNKVPPQPRVSIRLVDGSVLYSTSLGINSNQLFIETHCGAKLKIASRNVEAIRFKTYEDELNLSKQWRTILADDSRQGDAIVINRDGELDTVEGIVGKLAEEKLTFSIEDRTARVPVSKMDAVLFYHASGREFGSAVCELILTDQSRLRLNKLEWVDSLLSGQAVCGSTFEVPLDKISKLNFSLGRDTLLSSLKPSTNDWRPLITSSAILEKLRRMKLARTNESFSGQPLSLKYHTDSGLSFLAKNKQFENGFAIQGGGKLAFALNGQYDRLTGTIGFDPAASTSGNVRLKILLDGKSVLEKEMIHRLMKQPIELDLNVKNASRVVFQVDYNDGRSTGDQIHLVDLRVSQ